jgi:hypothetical protein
MKIPRDASYPLCAKCVNSVVELTDGFYVDFTPTRKTEDGRDAGEGDCVPVAGIPGRGNPATLKDSWACHRNPDPRPLPAIRERGIRGFCGVTGPGRRRASPKC